MKEISGIWLPDSDTHFEHHLKNSELVGGKGTYQLKKIMAALKVSNPRRRALAVDVGAHVGLWTRILAREFKNVVAFEPIPEFVECWKKNVPENVRLHEVALSNVPGILDMEYCSDNSGNTHVAPSHIKPEVFLLRTKAKRLDDFKFESSVDFLKIDVEGWECFVVQGAVETIMRDKPLIVVEQKPNNAERFGRKRNEALDMLLGLGYVRMWEIAGDHCIMHKNEVPAK